jgi:hypothetical protein
MTAVLFTEAGKYGFATMVTGMSSGTVSRPMQFSIIYSTSPILLRGN